MSATDVPISSPAAPPAAAPPAAGAVYGLAAVFYFLVVDGGALGLGRLGPYLVVKSRKPSWRSADAEEVTVA